MKNYIVLLALLLPFFVQGQVVKQSAAEGVIITTYATLEDFKEGNGTSYENYFSISHGMATTKLQFVKPGAIMPTSVNLKNVWGYSIGDAVFRVDHTDTNYPMRVLKVGDIIYYENGFAHMQMVLWGREEGFFSGGYHAYLSKDLESDPLPFPKKLNGKAKKRIQRFRDAHPEYEDLFDCFMKDYNWEEIFPCIVDLEKEAEDSDD